MNDPGGPADRAINDAEHQDPGSKLEEALSGSSAERYVLRLFVTGSTPQSARAILNLRKVCDERLGGRYDLEVIDIYQQPELAIREQIVAVPTLIKALPLPLRKLIGNLSDMDRVLIGLGLASRV
jgi:circadian clock protein KaiB